MPNSNVVLFGGTFDPIHRGHLQIAADVAGQLDAERVILVVSAAPPHKLDKSITPFEHRLCMAWLGVRDNSLFEVSDCEGYRDGPSYTLDTIRHFREELGEQVGLYWLIGADTLPELPTWYRAEELLDECTIVTAARPGYDPGQLPDHLAGIRPDQFAKLKDHILRTSEVDLASTEIREKIARGQDISQDVPIPVAQYIATQGLYRQ